VCVRRVGLVAAAVGLFLGGGAAGWAVKPAAVREVVVLPLPTDPPQDDPPPPPRSLSAGELELKAELADDPADVARLYREAGDQYLTADKDYLQAARCYRLHLNAAAPDARRVAVSDSWLLMSMKAQTP
jgi:hypothetical protein